MTTTHHVIVDAGGNIYPATFAKDADGAQCRLFMNENPSIATFGVDYMAEWWKSRQAMGDRCVRCTVETHETVKVTILP